MRARSRRGAALCLALLQICFLTGCLGASEIEEYGYVQSFGIAVGEIKKYSYSFLLQYYAAAGEGGGSAREGNGGVIVTAEGDTVFEAIASAAAALPYELNFSRTATVFLSEEIARSEGVEQLMAMSFSAMKLRYSLRLFVVNGDPKAFQEGLQVKNSPDLMQLQRSVSHSNRAEGTVSSVNYAMLYEAVETGRFDVVAEYGGVDMAALEQAKGTGGNDAGAAEGGAQGADGKGGEDAKAQSPTPNGAKRSGGMPAYAEGAALFDGTKMVGSLNGEETKYMLMARGELGRANIDYARPDGQTISIQIMQRSKPRVRLSLEPEPRAQVYIPLVCQINYDDEDSVRAEWLCGVQAELERHVQDAIRGVFISCRDMGCDAFGFGRHASMCFSDMQAWKDYGWKRRYGQMEAVFEVRLILWDAYVETEVE